MTKYTIVEAKRDHPSWFSRGAMKFFNSQVHCSFSAQHAVFLVQSTAYDEDGERRFSIVRFSETTCDTIGPMAGEAPSQYEPVREVAQILARAERSGGLRERFAHRAEFVPCELCDERAGWAIFQVASEAGFVDVCPSHVLKAMRLGVEL